MAEGTIGLPIEPPAGGKRLRTQEVDLGAGTIEQEVVVLADPDGTLASLSSLVAELAALVAAIDKQNDLYPPRALQFARTTDDQMRVVIGSGATDASAIRWGNNNSQPTYYSTGSPNSMDSREVEETQCKANFLQTRLGRWTVT